MVPSLTKLLFSNARNGVIKLDLMRSNKRLRCDKLVKLALYNSFELESKESKFVFLEDLSNRFLALMCVQDKLLSFLF